MSRQDKLGDIPRMRCASSGGISGNAGLHADVGLAIGIDRDAGLHRNAVLDRVARDPRCHGYSGADLDNLHVAAAQAAVKRAKRRREQEQQQQEGAGVGAAPAPAPPNKLTAEDWEAALDQISPSVSAEHARKFRKLKETGWE